MSETEAGPRAGRPAPTIYDIAQHAGVSPSTVSRALNRPGRVNKETAQRIQAAARELNYRANAIARALPTGRTRTLALILTDLTNPFFFEVIRGAEAAAGAAGYTLVVVQSQENPEREAQAIRDLIGSVDGFLLAASRLTDAEIQEVASERPAVVINRAVQDVDSIVPDLHPSIDETLDHLQTLGHRVLAFLSGPVTSRVSQARWHVVFEGAVERGMNIIEIGSGTPTVEGGRDSLARVRASGATAVLAYNDLMAIGLMRAARAAGMEIPDELSIVGFDDIFGSDFTSPPLTTVKAPLAEMGARAVRSLLQHLLPAASAESETPPALRTELLLRGSTAQAPQS
jgi:LacI family transcriptional regulator